MKKRLPKTPRLRLDAEGYRQLHREVLARDGWQRQACGSMRNLQIHHSQFRSKAGPAEEHNLITLCASCHAKLHEHHCNAEFTQYLAPTPAASLNVTPAPIPV